MLPWAYPLCGLPHWGAAHVTAEASQEAGGLSCSSGGGGLENK